ncbi:PARP-domain-containing protein [Xylariaceae sp. FL0255]|nr:PARP-domain-containing protein [Xylariaceae sp. FL0255]
MPRALKQTSSATPPLADCVIALSGTTPGHTQASIETNFITPAGATLSKSITANTTHLVASQADYEKPSAKVTAAQSKGIPIITFAWLQTCLSSNARVKEDMYSLAQSNGTPKHGVDEEEDEDKDEVAPPPKKKGKSKHAQSRQAEDEDALPLRGKDEPAYNGPKEKEAKVAERSIAKTLHAKIPVDATHDHTLAGFEVFIDNNGVIYDASLNQTNSTNNNNKFYRIQILRNVHSRYITWTRWGRVGDYGQTKQLGNGTLPTAIREFDKKFKSKTGLSWEDRNESPKSGLYAFIEKSYEDDSEEDTEENEAAQDGIKKEENSPESTLPKPTQELMRIIFNQDYMLAAMSDLNYDAKKLPLGKLSTNTLSRGYQALKDLSELLQDSVEAERKHGQELPEVMENLSNLYYTLIPHAFGRNRPPIINTEHLLKKEIELLESLGDMKDTASLMKKDKAEEINELDRQFRGLGMNEMTPLAHDSQEFLQIKDYLLHTRGSTHLDGANFQVGQIFRIERDGENERFKTAHPKQGDRRLLWHRSRVTNFGGILKQGLRIAPPEAPVSGYMFGKGIYLADMSSKSANYCCAGISNGHALLLLCEAELGSTQQKLTNASSNAGKDAKMKGLISTWGQGTEGPSKWKDVEDIHPSLKGVLFPDIAVKPGATGVANAYLQYNEYICYNVNQVRLRYLLQIRM